MSFKALANLVCESSVRTTENVLSRELQRNIEDLKKGVLAFGSAPTDKGAKPGPQSHRKLAVFIHDLSHFLQVDEASSKRILSTYLAGDFRGTKDSLKMLLNEERYRKPLLKDIWFFYRAERLYILQVLKEILSNARSTEHNHTEIFSEVFYKLRKGDGLKTSLFSQLKSVLSESPPTRETIEQNFSEDIVTAWSHNNLRELAEILQLLLLFYYNSDEEEDKKELAHDFIELLKLFQTHGFGRKIPHQNLKGVSQCDLLQAIGALESLLLVCLMDLPRLTSGVHDGVWSKVPDIDNLITSLGNKPDHGPVMLAWMLAHFIVDEEFGRFRTLGERAVQLKVISYLQQSLSNDVIISNSAVSSVTYSIVFGVISVLVNSFDPSRMNMERETHQLMTTLLVDKRIASTFWKLGFDSGLGFIFASKLSKFPAEMSDVLEVCAALAEASSESADEVLHCLEHLRIFTVPVESLSSRDLIHKGGDQFELTVARSFNSVHIPKGAHITTEGNFYLIDVSYDGIKYLMGEVEQLIRQASLGSAHVSRSLLENVILITKLQESLLRNGTNCLNTHMHFFSKASLLLVEKCVRLPLPPVAVLANCLKGLTLVARQRPHSVWERLSETGIFPFLTTAIGCLPMADEADVNPAIVGALLAQHECVVGLYPLTMAFLDLLLACINADTVSLVQPSVLYVIQDIFPSYQQWRFQETKMREIFGQKLLLVIRRVVLMKKDSPLQTSAIRALMSPAPNQTLLTLASTGDRVIQSLFESQSNMEGGVGVELSRCVHLALSILNILLRKNGLENLSALQKVLCLPPQSSRPHFLLTVSHYLYHLQSGDLPLAALKLLTTVATILPMSLLACLGSDAEAFRDILLHRLEAKTEDIVLKIAVIKFFTSCVDSQPGLIQLLIGMRTNIQVVRGKSDLSAQEKVDNDSLDLVDDSGCLSTVLELLLEFSSRDHEDESSYDLHVALVEFVYSLWSNQRVVALSILKRNSKFWESLTKPLFQTYMVAKSKLIGSILSIISSEIYTYKGKVDSSLISVLEKITDDKESYLTSWCQVSTQTEMDFNDSTLIEDHETKQMDNTDSPFLLSAWKSFLIVLASDQPIAVNPKTCQGVISSLLRAIRDHLKLDNADLHATTALSETCLVLTQRWQTKCAEKMDVFVQDQAELLAETSLVFDSLNPRTRYAILGIASTTLKFSSFMMEKEEEVLSTWLRPVVDIVEKSFSSESCLDPKDKRQILSLCLLQNLISRFTNPTIWQPTLHQRLIVPSILSTLHHSIRAQVKPDLSRECLSLLVLIARSKIGCDVLLSGCDFSQMLWLPLSTISLSGVRENWSPVFVLSIDLATMLLRTGKQQALDNSISAAALLQEHLTSFLLSLRDGVMSQYLNLTVTSAAFISAMMPFYKQWQLYHSSSLVHFYSVICSLVHRCACLLIRPSFLNVIIGQQHDKELNSVSDLSESRCSRRRMSSADYVDGSSDAEISPETTSVQNRLLDILSSGLSSLLALSPDLLSLVTDDFMDFAAFEKLLHVGFSTPSFEQDESHGLSYGTVIAICNLCIRALTRFSDRSLSPSKISHETPTGMDKRRLVLVLEKAVTLILSQGLLFLADQTILPRDKQLLRRELGAELGSITENVRRYFHRGSTKSPLDSGKSPMASKFSKSDESFMKFAANVVQKTFK